VKITSEEFRFEETRDAIDSNREGKGRRFWEEQPFQDSRSSIGLNRVNFCLAGYSDRKFHYDWVKVRDPRSLEVTIKPRSKFSVDVSMKRTLEIARRSQRFHCSMKAFPLVYESPTRFSLRLTTDSNAAAQDFTSNRSRTRDNAVTRLMPLHENHATRYPRGYVP